MNDNEKLDQNSRDQNVMDFGPADDVSIADLIEKEFYFYIPEYQRGYRWRSKHISDFLSDVKSAKDEKDWNCIQPIVVSYDKPIEDSSKKKHHQYILIDGQQRLTTIKIIIECINKKCQEKGTQPLGNIILKYPDGDSRDEINKRFEENAENVVTNCLGKMSDEEIKKFSDSLLKYTKVLWYRQKTDEVDALGAVNVFTRMNVDRIPLSPAELLKAFFLRRHEFSDCGENVASPRQMEISCQWNAIESSLLDDRLWLMFNTSTTSESCRISRLFRVVYALDESQDKEKRSENDSESVVFRHFSDKINKENSLASVEEVWGRVVFVYNTICSWYEDVDMFHLVSMYFIILGAPLRNLIAEWKKRDKVSFKNHIRDAIRKALFGEQEIDVVVTGSDYYQDKRKTLAHILLLHNVATSVRRNWPEHRWDVDQSPKMDRAEDGQIKNLCSRFPFHMYKMSKWNLEHISPSSGDNSSDSQRQKFIEGVERCINDFNEKDEKWEKLINCIEEYKKKKNETEFSEIINQLKSMSLYSSLEDENNEDLQNNLANLALLDEGTNKSYGNSIFLEKRRNILGRVKHPGTMKISKYSFIMPCTLSVFTKEYRDLPDNLLCWNADDATSYREDVINTIKDFLKHKSF